MSFGITRRLLSTLETIVAWLKASIDSSAELYKVLGDMKSPPQITQLRPSHILLAKVIANSRLDSSKIYLNFPIKPKLSFFAIESFWIFFYYIPSKLLWPKYNSIKYALLILARDHKWDTWNYQQFPSGKDFPWWVASCCKPFIKFFLQPLGSHFPKILPYSTEMGCLRKFSFHA